MIPVFLTIYLQQADDTVSKIVTGTSKVKIDIHHLAFIQNIKTYVDGLCIQFLSLKLMQCFRINHEIDWLFIAIGQTIGNLFTVYVILVPFLFCLAFVNYYLFGLSNYEVSNGISSVFSMYRNILGLASTRTFYRNFPVSYFIVSMFLIMFWFYLFMPVTIALLLDSFQNTVMKFGRINDYSGKRGWSLRQIFDWITVLKPWKELQDEMDAITTLEKLK